MSDGKDEWAKVGPKRLTYPCPQCVEGEHDACWHGEDEDCECWEYDHFGYFQSPEWLEGN